RMFGYRVERDCETTVALLRQRLGIGVPGTRSDSRRERICVGIACGDEPGPPCSQRAGLVEDDCIDICEPLERAAVPDHDALVEQPLRGNDMHHGDSEAKR